ncbi:MAG TPA: alpha/beta hydrolase [Steroidobacteraceae bacterium]
MRYEDNHGVLLGFFAMCAVTSLRAQDIAGTWQGVLHAASGRNLRVVVKIERSAKGGWIANLYSIDESPDAIPFSSVDLSGETVKLDIADLHASYQGTLDARRDAITGTWMQIQTSALNLQRATASTAWALDSSPHTVRFVTVEKGVSLEVLDWGGTGRPLVFLAGRGGNAHGFDKLAPKFTGNHHVYAITRRGYGASSRPDPASADYSADRLGNDVLAVIAVLKLERPVLAGHSIAGEELSSVGSRHPEKVAGLVYLDAGYSYAYYVPGNVIPLGTNLQLSARDLQANLDRLKALPPHDQDLAPLMRDAQASLKQFETDLVATQAALKAEPAESADASVPPQSRTSAAIFNGARKYTKIDVPILALFESPPFLPDGTPPEVRVAENDQFATQATRFEAGLSAAHVVRLANARHALWQSNEADVLREMNAFMAELK